MSRRVLVVDDDAGIRSVTQALLQSAGYAVSECARGDEALGALRAGAADLLLHDVNLPGMDGWETLRLIQADPAIAALPVVMFSVKGEIRDKVHALQEGAFDYINKPFDGDELVDRIGRVLEAWLAARAGEAVP